MNNTNNTNNNTNGAAHHQGHNVALRMRYSQICEDCGESDFVDDHSSGDLICRSCGRVAESHVIDEGSEWRTFGDKEEKGGADPTRVGGPTNVLLGDGGLSTMIAGGKGVDKGLEKNLQRMQQRTDNTGVDKTLQMAFRDIGRICSSMKLPDIVKAQANEYFRDALEKNKSVKGRQLSASEAAVVFLACRKTGYPRTFKEIRAYVPQARVKDIGKMYKTIVADLKLKENGELDEVVSVHPENFLRRFMSNLGFTRAEMMSAIALANVVKPKCEDGVGAEHRPWDGRSPVTMAATIMYIMSFLMGDGRKRPSLDDICSVAGLAPQTVGIFLRELREPLPGLVKRAGGFATAEDLESKIGWL